VTGDVKHGNGCWRRGWRYFATMGGAVTDTPNPQVVVPDLCKTHLSLLVHQAGWKKYEPWRAWTVMAQITLFQGVTGKLTTWEHLDKDVTRLPELGCLGCFAPDIFGEVVEAAKKEKQTPGSLKRLGEMYCDRGLR